MPETNQSQEMTAADVRKLLLDKFPPEKDDDGKIIISRDYVVSSVVMELAKDSELAEKALVKLFKTIREMSAVISVICEAAEIDLPKLILAIRSGQVPAVSEEGEGDEERDDEIVGGGSSAGAAGAGGGSAGATAGGGSGAAAAPATPLSDKTPFPAGVSANIKPGDTAQKVTVQTPPPKVAESDLNTADEEDDNGLPKPNIQSGPATNAAPIPGGPKVNPPSPNGAKA